MAKLSHLTKQELASKLVQEIAEKGDEIPERYRQKDGFPEAIDDLDLWRNELLIDFSLLSSTSTSELAKLRSALCQWGCFQVVNHGMESSFLEELIEDSKQFFALPLDEKFKCSGSVDIFEGYGNDSIYAEVKKKANWNDRLFLTLHPKECCKLQFWPTKPENMRGMLEEYSRKIVSICEALYKAMARSLNLEEGTFLNTQGKGLLIGKLSLYPRCSSPKNVLGFGPHTDGTTMSIILPEKGVEGLHIKKDDLWYKVSPTPGALFINLGDLGEVMTNGVFKSAMHRVVTSSIKDRISVGAFYHPEEGKEIAPVSQLISADQPQLYRKFSVNEYRQIFFKSYALGHHPLDAFKI